MKILRKIYSILKKGINTLLWTNVWEYYWKNRKWNNWIENWYWEWKKHTHRSFLINTLLGLNPKSILEIWSNCWPNLAILAERNPDIDLFWIDINKESINFWNDKFKKLGYNVKLYEWNADDLKEFPDNSVDIVFTDAILIYIWRDKIIKTINELKRVWKKYIVILELYDENDDWLWTYKWNWFRNYKKLFINNIGIKKEDIQIDKLPEELWTWDWSKNWYIITIKI